MGILKRILNLLKGIKIDPVTGREFYSDKHGYYRWRDTNRLIHRDVAYEEIYKQGSHTLPFSKYDVHHKDQNKRNNDPSNLQLVTREKHQTIHGQRMIINGEPYVRLCRRSKIYRETRKVILVAHRWVPKSQALIQGKYVFVKEYVYNRKFLSAI